MANVVVDGIVNRLPLVLDLPLRSGRGNDLVLSGHGLVRRQDPDLPSSHFLFVNSNCLSDVIHLRLHFTELLSLKIQGLEEVVGQGVDLVGDGGQALGCVALGLLEGGPLIVALVVVVLAVLGHPLQVREGVQEVLPPLRDVGGDQGVEIGRHDSPCVHDLLFDGICHRISGFRDFRKKIINKID